jgi:hypothetical protein
VKSQEAVKPAEERTKISESPGVEPMKNTGSILLLGYGDERAKETVRESCGDRFATTPAGFRVGGTIYEGPRFALLVSCPRRGVPGSVVSLLYGVTPESVSNVARLLFFYGWNSYVVFKDGGVVARGDWEMDIKHEVVFE